MCVYMCVCVCVCVCVLNILSIGLHCTSLWLGLGLTWGGGGAPDHDHLAENTLFWYHQLAERGRANRLMHRIIITSTLSKHSRAIGIPVVVKENMSCMCYCSPTLQYWRN